MLDTCPHTGVRAWACGGGLVFWICLGSDGLVYGSIIVIRFAINFFFHFPSCMLVVPFIVSRQRGSWECCKIYVPTQTRCTYIVLYLVNKSFHIIPKIKKKEMYCKVKKKQVACMVDGNKSNDEEARRRDACMKFRALHEVRRLRNIAFGIKWWWRRSDRISHQSGSWSIITDRRRVCSATTTGLMTVPSFNIIGYLQRYVWCRHAGMAQQNIITHFEPYDGHGCPVGDHISDAQLIYCFLHKQQGSSASLLGITFQVLIIIRWSIYICMHACFYGVAHIYHI